MLFSSIGFICLKLKIPQSIFLLPSIFEHSIADIVAFPSDIIRQSLPLLMVSGNLISVSSQLISLQDPLGYLIATGPSNSRGRQSILLSSYPSLGDHIVKFGIGSKNDKSNEP